MSPAAAAAAGGGGDGDAASVRHVGSLVLWRQLD